MLYVSAKFIKDPDSGATDRLIEAIDDQGRVWSVPGMDCQVGDWQHYLAEGGTVDPYEAEIGQSVTEAPADLFGGPTLEDVFSGNG